MLPLAAARAAAAAAVTGNGCGSRIGHLQRSTCSARRAERGRVPWMLASRHRQAEEHDIQLTTLAKNSANDQLSRCHASASRGCPVMPHRRRCRPRCRCCCGSVACYDVGAGYGLHRLTDRQPFPCVRKLKDLFSSGTTCRPPMGGRCGRTSAAAPEPAPLPHGQVQRR